VRGLLAYLVFRALAGLAALLPEPVVRRLGYGLGYLKSFVKPRERRMAERHQRRVQGPRVNARRAARRVLGYYGRYYAETFWIRPRRRQQILDSCSVENLEGLRAAVADPRGVILAVAHQGNWEAAGLQATAEGAPVLAAAEGLANERLVRWFVGVRRVMGIEVVLVRRGASVTPALEKRLQEGGVVALMFDRDLKGTGIPVTLFGERTTLPAGTMNLALRTGAMILPAGIYHKRGAGHIFHIHPPFEVPGEGSFDERVAEGTQRLAGVLEQMILRAPEQWHVLQPVWPGDREAR
jgi:KDO2-lipid IV(A) lauroyltransferase